MQDLTTTVRGLLAALGLITLLMTACQKEPEAIESDCPPKVEWSPPDQEFGIMLDVPELPTIAFSGYGGMAYIHLDDSRLIIARKGIANEDRTEYLRTGLIKYHLDTQEESWVYEGDSWESAVNWSRTGWLLKVVQHRLLLVSTEGEPTRQLTTYPGEYYGPTWSYDGKKVLCWGREAKRASRKLFIFNLEGELINVDSSQNAQLFGGGDWNEEDIVVGAADSSFTFFQYADSSLTLIKRIKIGHIDPEARGIGHFRWRPGHSKVIWTNNRGLLYETDFDTEQTRLIYDNCHRRFIQFDPTPDGEAIWIGVSDYHDWADPDLRDATAYIHEIDLDTGEETRVYTFPDL
jgi:hypothetical protein